MTQLNDIQANMQALEQNLGYEFKRPELLRTALCHSSYMNECRESVKCNERLEFLGDAVVNLAIAEALMKLAPDVREGQLSAIRATLVSEKGLAEVADSVGLPQMLILGKGEEQDGGRAKKSLLSDAMEAVFAAVYLDSDFETVSRVIQHVFGDRCQDALEKKYDRDYKTMLQEYLQNKRLPLPVYELVDVTGPDHKRHFCMRIVVNDMKFLGSGSNKKKAQQDAAKNAMLFFEELGDENS